MNKSLEALERFKLLYESKCKEQPKNLIGFDMCYVAIKQDLERLEELEEENQELKELQELNKQGLWNLKQENQKLKKVIDWLKHTFEITLDSKVRISDGIDCIQAFPIDMKNNEVIYELLKEVVEE